LLLNRKGRKDRWHQSIYIFISLSLSLSPTFKTTSTATDTHPPTLTPAFYRCLLERQPEQKHISRLIKTAVEPAALNQRRIEIFGPFLLLLLMYLHLYYTHPPLTQHRPPPTTHKRTQHIRDYPFSRQKSADVNPRPRRIYIYTSSGGGRQETAGILRLFCWKHIIHTAAARRSRSSSSSSSGAYTP
jgi:hypothetical protein